MADKKHGSNRAPKSPAAVMLGAKLRGIRRAAGKTTYEIQRADGKFYGSGTISSIEGGYSVPSEAIISAYVGLSGNYTELMALLRKTRQVPTGYTTETTEVWEFEQALQDVHADPNILRLGYDVEMAESSDYFNEQRVPSRIIHRVSLHPRSPRTRFFVFRYGYEYDLSPGVASVQAGIGCSIALLAESEVGILYTVLGFDPGAIAHRPGGPERGLSSRSASPGSCPRWPLPSGRLTAYPPARKPPAHHDATGS